MPGCSIENSSSIQTRVKWVKPLCSTKRPRASKLNSHPAMDTSDFEDCDHNESFYEPKKIEEYSSDFCFGPPLKTPDFLKINRWMTLYRVPNHLGRRLFVFFNG